MAASRCCRACAFCATTMRSVALPQYSTHTARLTLTQLAQALRAWTVQRCRVLRYRHGMSARLTAAAGAGYRVRCTHTLQGGDMQPHVDLTKLSPQTGGRRDIPNPTTPHPAPPRPTSLPIPGTSTSQRLRHRRYRSTHTFLLHLRTCGRGGATVFLSRLAKKGDSSRDLVIARVVHVDA